MAVAHTLSDFTDKLPPQSLEAERALLGCMLLSNESIDEVADIVQPPHFYLDKHRRMAEAIYRLTSLCTFADRFVIPPAHREEAMELMKDPQEHVQGAGFGFLSGPRRGL